MLTTSNPDPKLQPFQLVALWLWPSIDTIHSVAGIINGGFLVFLAAQQFTAAVSGSSGFARSIWKIMQCMGALAAMALSFHTVFTPGAFHISQLLQLRSILRPLNTILHWIGVPKLNDSVGVQPTNSAFIRCSG
jgi:hypothetical protein